MAFLEALDRLNADLTATLPGVRLRFGDDESDPLPETTGPTWQFLFELSKSPNSSLRLTRPAESNFETGRDHPWKGRQWIVLDSDFESHQLHDARGQPFRFLVPDFGGHRVGELAWLADAVHEAILDHLPGHVWPPCPASRSHPLFVKERTTDVVWRCDRHDLEVPIGDLARRRRSES